MGDHGDDGEWGGLDWIQATKAHTSVFDVVFVSPGVLVSFISLVSTNGNNSNNGTNDGNDDDDDDSLFELVFDTSTSTTIRAQSITLATVL